MSSPTDTVGMHVETRRGDVENFRTREKRRISPFQWGGRHVASSGRMAAPDAHDHIDHIGGHIDHIDGTNADHKRTARAATPKYLSSLIFPRLPASGRSHRSHRSHGF